MTQRQFNITLYGSLIILLLYYMNVHVVVDVIHAFKDTWNYVVDYVLTFRYKQPITFLFLPVVAVWLLSRR